MRHRSGKSVRELSVCERCGKLAFKKKDAQKVVRLSPEKWMRKYPCPAWPGSNWWHVGHLPVRVRHGMITMNEYLGESRGSGNGEEDSGTSGHP